MPAHITFNPRPNRYSVLELYSVIQYARLRAVPGVEGGGGKSSYILTSVKALFVVKKKYNGTGGRGDSSYILQSATALFLLMQYYIGTGGGGV